MREAKGKCAEVVVGKNCQTNGVILTQYGANALTRLLRKAVATPPTNIVERANVLKKTQQPTLQAARQTAAGVVVVKDTFAETMARVC